MDGTGDPQPGKVRFEGQSPNENFGLLCPWYGDLRNHQWGGAIPRTRGLCRFLEGPGGCKSYSRGRVRGQCVEDVEDVLEAPAE